MQTSIAKIATVILAITAVCFMGMSVAAYYGRPDPIAEMRSPEIADFRFEATASAEKTTWTVTPSVGPKDQQTPVQKETAYAALLQAYSAKSTRVSAETAEITGLTTQIRDKIKQVEAEQDLDVNALDARIGNLRSVVDRVDAELLQKSDQLQKLSVETRVVRDETASRREDVQRLQNDLAELRTDVFRLEQLRLTLTDRLLRYQLENQSIQRRLQQLNSQTQ